MNITFDDAVRDRLLLLKGSHEADLVLDFDHTLSRENIGQDCCGITRYRIVLVEKGSVPEVFNASISSNFGSVYFKEWGQMYLDDEMNIRFNGPLIEIMGRGELIAPNIEIVDFRGDQLKIKAEKELTV